MGINVLSLFDGMSCGQIALDKLGVEVDNYYASEVDKYAMQIAKKNYPNTHHIGDVTKVKSEDLSNIDLLIGGSPCQGFSFAGKQLNFDDPRSKLFFEFVRLLEETKPKYFLLENVKMKKESMAIISKYLGCEPVEINSALLSAQNRKRLYWTNIPGLEQPEDNKTYLRDILLTSGDPICYSTSGRGAKGVEFRMSSNDKAHTLSTGGYGNRSFSGVVEELKHTEKAINYMNRTVKGGRNHWDFKHHSDSKNDKSSALVANLYKGVPYNVLKEEVLVHNIYGGFQETKCRVFNEKGPTLRANSGGGSLPSVFNGTGEEAQSMDLKELRTVIRKLHPIECERLQTVPDNYTEGVSNTQRYKMLGNGWTVDVIAHIFKGMEL